MFAGLGPIGSWVLMGSRVVLGSWVLGSVFPLCRTRLLSEGARKLCMQNLTKDVKFTLFTTALNRCLF